MWPLEGNVACLMVDLWLNELYERKEYCSVGMYSLWRIAAMNDADRILQT